MLKTEIKPVSRKSDLVTQELGNEILIYDLTANKAYNLNESSALIWQLCDGNRTVSDIARNLTGRFDAPVTEDFVWLALEQLKKDNLLENAGEVSTDFGGLSRREVIRKVSFATFIALPVVSSLVAPIAAQANSAVCRTVTCRCPVGTTDCNGSTATVGGVSYVSCLTAASNNNPNCNCITNSSTTPNAGMGFIAGTCALQ